MKKNKKGFILGYAAVLMAVVVILLVSAIGVLESDVKSLKMEKSKFNTEWSLSQVEEYLLVGDFGAASAATIGTNITIDRQSDSTGDTYYFTVYLGNTPRLYIERYRGQTVKIIHGAKPTE